MQASKRAHLGDLIVRSSNLLLALVVPAIASTFLADRELALLVLSSGLMMVVNLLDFGFGNALVNRVIESGRQIRGSLRAKVYAIQVALLGLVLFLGSAISIAAFNLQVYDSSSFVTILQLVPLVGLLVATSLTRKVLFAQLALANVQICSSVLASALVAIAYLMPSIGPRTLIGSIYLLFSNQILISLMSQYIVMSNGITFAGTAGFSAKLIRRSLTDLWPTAKSFFWLACLGIPFFALDFIFIAQSLSSEKAIDYAIVWRFLAIAIQVSAVATAPLWIIMKRLEMGEPESSSHVAVAFGLTCLFGIIYFLGIGAFGSKIARVWLDVDLIITPLMTTYCFFYFIAINCHTILEHKMNSLNSIQYQAKSMTLVVMAYVWIIYLLLPDHVYEVIFAKSLLLLCNCLNYMFVSRRQ